MGEARRVVELGYAIWNEGKPGLIDLVHPHATANYTDVGELLGAEAVVNHWQTYKTAFPDGHVEFNRIIESGNLVVVESTFTGTNTGPLSTPMGELPATGKSVSSPGCEIYEIVDGKVASVAGYFDVLGLMAQLGLMPAITPAAL